MCSCHWLKKKILRTITLKINDGTEEEAPNNLVTVDGENLPINQLESRGGLGRKKAMQRKQLRGSTIFLEELEKDFVVCSIIRFEEIYKKHVHV